MSKETSKKKKCKIFTVLTVIISKHDLTQLLEKKRIKGNN